MPDTKDPKYGISEWYKKAKFGRLKGPVSRIRPVKPIKLPRGELVYRRRGIRIPWWQEREWLEKRAIPRSKLYGTLPERILYKALVYQYKLDVDFQSSLLGGRQEAGGRILDFLVFMPYGPVGIRMQSYAFHLGVEARRKDEEDKRIIESLIEPVTGKHYVVYDIWEDTVYDIERLNEWIQRNLLGNYQGQGLRAPRVEVEWMPKREEWNALLARDAQQQALIANLIDRVAYLEMVLTTGDMGPEIQVGNPNLRAQAVTAAKVADATITGDKIASATITATNIAASTITPAKLSSVQDQAVIALYWPSANSGWNTVVIAASQALNFYLANYTDVGGGLNSEWCEWEMSLTAGTWELKLLHTTTNTSGIVDVLIDDVEVGSIDFYSADETFNVAGTVSDISVATGGAKTIKLLVDGKNGSSSGYDANVTLIQMVKTA